MEPLPAEKGFIERFQGCLIQEYTIFQTWDHVGITTGHCQQGDCLAKLDGTTQPFVLQQVAKDTYRIVGACYLGATRKLEREDEDAWNLVEDEWAHRGLRQAWDAHAKQTIEIH
jgi:hypothetical protein